MAVRDKKHGAQHAIDGVLSKIIDEWYEKVANYYVTKERIEEGKASGDEELKRFHDENGHRIKFSKDSLDFTYGLRSYWQSGNLLIEVSVNNKMEDFDYDLFRSRLAAHYRKTGKEKVPTPAELRNHSYADIFRLGANFSDAFKVELRKGKADIMGLVFEVNPETLDKLVARPVSCKNLVEDYCVTPFRRVFATVYRRAS